MGSSDHPDAVDNLDRWLAISSLGEDGDVVAALGLRARERLDMTPKAAVDDRGVLPRHVQHAHRLSIGLVGEVLSEEGPRVKRTKGMIALSVAGGVLQCVIETALAQGMDERTGGAGVAVES